MLQEILDIFWRPALLSVLVSIPDASVSGTSSHWESPHGDTFLWTVDILGFIFRLLMQICVTSCRKRKSSWRKRTLSKKKLWRMKKLWTPELKSLSKFSFTSTLCLSFMLLSLYVYLKMQTHTHARLKYWYVWNHVSLDQVCTFYKDCCATWSSHTHTHTALMSLIVHILKESIFIHWWPSNM